MSNTLRPDPNGYKKRAAEANFPQASRLKVTKEGNFRMEDETENGERGGGPIAMNLADVARRFEDIVVGVPSGTYGPPASLEVPIYESNNSNKKAGRQRNEDEVDSTNHALDITNHPGLMNAYMNKIDGVTVDFPPLLEMVHMKETATSEPTFMVDTYDPNTIHKVQNRSQQMNLQNNGCTLARIIPHDPFSSARVTSLRGEEEISMLIDMHQRKIECLMRQRQAGQNGDSNSGTVDVSTLPELTMLPGRPTSPRAVIDAVERFVEIAGTKYKPLGHYFNESTWSRNLTSEVRSKDGTRNFVLYYLALVVPVPGVCYREGKWYFKEDQGDGTFTEVEFSQAAQPFTKLKSLTMEWRTENIPEDSNRAEKAAYLFRNAKQKYDERRAS